ncbi:MAG: M56 family metallopeptidase, partial [Gemmatimonadaceae bacterium]
ANALLGIAWLGTSLLMSVALVAGLVQLSRARRRGRRVALAGSTVAITTDLGPGVVPFGRPGILVPCWATELSPRSVELLIAHEEEHVRAGDAKLLLAGVVVLATMPWNPVLWWSVRRLRTAIELDCDARVLRGGPAVADYAELLLSVAGRGHARAVPALLAFADSTSQLRTRIDAMTIVRSLTPVRRAALGVLAAVGLMVACETRMPDPVVPVSDYVRKDGRTATAALTRAQEDSLKRKVAQGLEVGEGPLFAYNYTTPADSGLSGDPTKPVLIVEDAAARVVFAARLDAVTEKLLKSVPASDIQSVEVLKRSNVLPRTVIHMKLTAASSWRPPVAGVSSSPSRDRALLSRAPDSSMIPSAPGGTGLPKIQLRSSNVLPPNVILRDASGRILYEGLMSPGQADHIGPYRIARADIDEVEVVKREGAGTIHIRLKPGAAPVRVK